MTSTLFVIVRICRKQHKCNYLKSYRHFFQYFPHLLESASNIKHFRKEDDPRSLRIFEFPDCGRHG